MARQERQIMDPLAAQLTELAKQCNGDPAHDVSAFLGLEKVFSAELARNAKFRAALEKAYASLSSVDSPAQLGEALTS
jgi:fructuronate reductase